MISIVAIFLWSLIPGFFVARAIVRTLGNWHFHRRWKTERALQDEKIRNFAHDVGESYWLLHLTKAESKKKRHSADLDRRLRRLCEAFDMEIRS